MKIKQFKKVGLNKYKLELEDGRKYTLYEEVLLNSNLLYKKEVEQETLKKLMSENTYYEVYYKALDLIKKKIRSKKELEKLLKEYDSSLVSDVLTRLEKERYLDSKIYIRSYVHDAFTIKGYGPLRIKNELMNLDFNEQDIIPFLEEIDLNELENKLQCWLKKKVQSNQHYGLHFLKQKLRQEAYILGYNESIFDEVWNHLNITNSNEIYEKEKEKLYAKYSKKYSGFLLEQKVKMALKQKGF